jgi:hypothetical protein
MSHRRSLVLVALLLLPATLLSAQAQAQVSIGISVNVAPPPLPVYEQPPIPEVGYIWVPGYWAWDGEDYYWVPGTWVLPPEVGFLWTPGYWGWVDGAYIWREGYWGPHVGFYGGIDYGFGYTGVGYEGGYWSNGAFFYNRAVNRMDGVRVTNVYNKTVINNITVNRVSFNGGRGGIQARPTAQQLAVEQQHHFAPVSAQVQQNQMARREPTAHAAVNHGQPAVAATPRPGIIERRDGQAPQRPAAAYTPRQEPPARQTPPRADVQGPRAPQPPRAELQAPRAPQPPRAELHAPRAPQPPRAELQAPRAPEPPARANPERGGAPQQRGPAQERAPAERGNGQERHDDQHGRGG